jgi:hypothetical protein
MRKWIVRILVAAVALFALGQAVPYGRSHSNPPVQSEPKWDSPQTRALAVRACYDCHSNETAWPWYTNVAPVSWLTQRDVDSGRSALNFSEWNRPQDGKGDIVEAVRGGDMPPWYYKPLHPRSKLSAADTDKLVAGLIRTLRR